MASGGNAVFSRRHWLRAAAGGLAGAWAVPAWPTKAAPDRAPRNVILLVSDGMSLGVPSLAEAFSQQVRGSGTEWWGLARRADCVSGYLDMGSLTSLVTDSAAAASSWGSGSRVVNGAVNVLPDGTRLTPMAHIVRNAGRRIGLVTTTTITHATPAGFAAVTRDRNDEADIAPQYLDSIDVLLGGGLEFFDPGSRADGRDLLADFRRAGYAMWSTRADVLSAASERRALGLFASGHLPYSIDRQQDPTLAARVPTLAEMTDAALAMLASQPRGFLLMIEGGRVDHAAHANDAAAILWDQLAFDDAIGRARAFAEARGDTLLVITTDHGNSNPGLNGMGPDYLDSNEHFERIAAAKSSVSAVRARLTEAASDGTPPSVDAAVAAVRDGLAVDIQTHEAEAVALSVQKRVPSVLNRQHSAFVGVLGQVLSNYWGVGWTGTRHTADLCPVLAIGPGCERFHGLKRNTDLFDDVLALMGVSFRNPSMSPDQARRVAMAANAVCEVIPT